MSCCGYLSELVELVDEGSKPAFKVTFFAQANFLKIKN